MVRKFRLIRVETKTLNNTIERSILDYVNKKDDDNEYAQQQQIIDHVRNDCKVSDKKLRDILVDMVDHRKLSTFYDKPFRYYSLPKLPLPIKVCLAMIGSILGFYLFIDIFVPKQMLLDLIYLKVPGSENVFLYNVNVFSYAFFCIIIVLFITLFWYYDYRKVYK